MARIKIVKPNADWKVLEKSIKSIQYIFGADCKYDMLFSGWAIDARTKECVFFDCRPTVCPKWKYTSRCTSGFMLWAEVDGEFCWIMPDENYSFDIIFSIEQE